jgi:hypothetical protein
MWGKKFEMILTKPPFTILNLKSKIFIKKTFLFIKISAAVSMKNITSKKTHSAISP